MKATSFQTSFVRNITMLVVLGSLAACTSPVGLDEDDNVPAERLYNVELNFKRVEIVGDCDKDTFVGDNEGEFSYWVGYSAENQSGTWSSFNTVSETQRYGLRDPEVIRKTDNGVISISKKVNLTLVDGLNYRMHMKAMEWDVIGQTKDSRMTGKLATEENSTGGSKLKYTHKLDLGDSNACKVRLHVEATETLK